METTSLPRNHWIVRLLASLGLVLILATSAAAQDAKPSKGKTSEKSAKKAAPKSAEPPVTYIDASPDGEPESDFPTIVTKKGAL